MRNIFIFIAVIIFCAITVYVGAQGQAMNSSCTPNGTVPGIGVCPPTGASMGQSNYQRSPHNETASSGAATKPMNAQSANSPVAAIPSDIETMPDKTSTDIEAEADIYATTPMPTSIAVDNDFIYVLRGDEVVKLAKSDMHFISTTKLPASPANK